MKRILALVLCGFAFAATAKDKPSLALPYNADGRVQYREVVEVAGVPSAELMKRARQWVAKTYKSAPDVVKGNEEDQLIVKGIILVSQGGIAVGQFTTWHMLTIDTKDGKCRVTIDGFKVQCGKLASDLCELESSGYQKAPNEPHFGYKSLFEGLDREVRSMMASLKAALATQPENW